MRKSYVVVPLLILLAIITGNYLPAGIKAPVPATTAVCITAAKGGACGPYTLNAGTYQRVRVIQDVWNPNWAFSSQVLTAISAGHWKVTADALTGNGWVLSYPDTSDDLVTPSRLPAPFTSFKSLTSVYDVRMPSDLRKAGLHDSYEAAYDIWLYRAGHAVPGLSSEQEIMIWGDVHNTRAAGRDLHEAWTDPSTRQVYEAWSGTGGAGGSLISLVRTRSDIHAGVSLAALFTWLQSRRLTSMNAVSGIGFGFEVKSTSSRPETFYVNEYTLNATCATGKTC